ncbi:MAG TPA: imidazole glycerol phosphate synthase subunit HisH, partial [Limnochordia bacterium]
RLRARKVPQIGWNTVLQRRASPLWQGIGDGAYAYFLHSYCVEAEDPSIVCGVTPYEEEFCSAISAGNVHAIQFHPEKSSRVGLIILANFGRLVSRWT